MDARAVLYPVGPHEPRVYWTRRAILVLAVILVIVLFAAYACAGGDPKPAANRPNTHPRTTPTPTSSTTPGLCTRDELTVSATTDATRYPAGVLPHLTATVRATAPCQLSTGSISWEIVSGPDTVFSTANCPKPSQVTTVIVRPNHPYRAGLMWDRHRSTTGCASPGAAAGSGTYQLRATVAGVQSAVAVFHLTG